MRAFFLTIVSVIITACAWAVLVYASVDQGWFHTSLAQSGNTQAFWSAAREKIQDGTKGNAAFILLQNKEIYNSHYQSTGPNVDGDTLFQVASLSKWVSAWGVLSLVEQGKLSLDQPVSKYLSRWQLPESQFDNQGVTVRKLLSHTAGLTDGLGYGGFLPGEEPQPLEASLSKASDASPGKDGRVMVGTEPGSSFAYSGGGYTLLQLLVEEVSGQSFNEYMKQNVFKPLGMDRTSYILDTSSEGNIAILYDEEGQPATHYKFTALAASSLYTSANDMARFIQAHFPAGSMNAGWNVLTPETLTLMRTPHASELGADIWGLGTILYASNNEGDFIAGHDGSNEPAINTTARYNPATGDGIIILETGNKLLATEVAGEWVYWQTGNIDLMLFSLMTENMINTILLGWLILLLGTAIIFVRLVKSRNRKKRAA